MSEERSRLSRWAERKAAARRGEVLAEPAEEVLPTPAEDVPPPQTASLEPGQMPDAEGVPADDDMPVLPPIEDLTAESDYTVFMNKKVPETLRRAALRKLWASDPVLANLDGLNDYDHDYNVIDTLITTAQTAYRVGKGYVEQIEEKLEEVEQALGNDAGQESAGQESHDSKESEARSQATADAASGDDAAILSESDAVGDNSPDATRQVAAVEPSAKLAHPREQSGE